MRGRVVACAAVLTLLSGCGGHDSSSVADPPTSTSPVQSTSPTDPTSPPTSSAPADPGGPTMRLPHIEVHLPKGYEIFAPGEADSDSFGPPQDTEIYVSEDPAFGETLDQEVALIEKNTAKGLTRQPDLTIDGIRGFVFSGRYRKVHRWYFSALTQDKVVSVKIDCPVATGFDALAATIATSIVLK